MTNKKKVRALPPYVFLSYLLVVTFVMTGLSFARFGNTMTAEDAARAATFEVSVLDAPDDQLVTVYHGEDGTKTCGNYVFKVTSTSEVPITYTIMTDTTGGDMLQRGIELTMTAVNTEEERNKAMAAGYINGKSATHRPNETAEQADGSMGLHVHKFVNIGTAPAGTHTQEFVLNFHYTEAGSAGSTATVSYKIWDGIKIKVIANDARDGASFRKTNNSAGTTHYTTPYTPAE